MKNFQRTTFVPNLKNYFNLFIKNILHAAFSTNLSVKCEEQTKKVCVKLV